MADTNKNVNILIRAKDQTKSAFKGVQDNLLGVAAALAAVKIATDVLLDITKVGAESEKAWLAVEGALKRHNIEVVSGTLEIRKFADEMQTLTGVSDEVVSVGTRRFIDFGASIEQAKEQMRVATDLASGSGISLSSAVDLISKAQVGYTSTLSRYGIIIDEAIPKNEKFAAAIEQITQKFGGAAQDVAGSFAVRMEVLSERIGDLKEDIFRLLQPALEAVLESFIAVVSVAADVIEALDSLVGFLSGTATELDRNAKETSAWVKEVDSLVKALEDAEIGIEDFKTNLAAIGVPDLKASELEDLSEGLFLVSDNTSRWGMSLEDLNVILGTTVDELEMSKTAALELGNIIDENRRLTAAREFPSLIGIDEEDLAEDEKQFKEHLDRILDAAKSANNAATAVAQQTFDVRLQMMTDFEATLFILEEERLERERIISEAKIEDQEVVNQLLLESQELFNEEMIILQEDLQEQLTEQWLERWELVVASTEKVFEDLFVALVTNAKSIGDVMKKTFQEIGRTIVRELAGLAVGAIFKYIASMFAAKAATEIQVEAVNKLRDAYIEQAAAQAAASLGATAAPALAAATGTLAGLNAILGGSAGLDISSAAGSLDGGGGGGVSGGGGGSFGAPAITINFNGGIVTDQLGIVDVLIPAIETAILDGTSRILIGDQNTNGGGNVAFA